MVTQFLGLKLRLLSNTFKRSPWQVVGIAVALLYGLATSAVVVASLVGLRFADADFARSIVVVFGSVAVLGFLVVPLVFGVDDTLDPRKFALFGLPTSRLAGLLALTALVGVPSLVITAIAIAQIVTWSRGPLPMALALVGAVVIVVTCVLGARVTTSLAAFLLSTRRAREISGLIALMALVALTPTIAVLAGIDWAGEGITALAGIADVLSWTPLGAAWAAPADAATGASGAAVQKLIIAIASAGALWLAWRALVGVMLITPHREGRPRDHAGLGWFDWLPSTPLGAIAARSFTYWVRDARYRVQLVIVPIVPMLMIVVFLISGVFWQNLALLPLPIMCLFLGWSLHNDVAYDNTAVWLHIASNTSGAADRLGRVIPVLLLGTVLIAVGAPISAMFYPDPSVLGSLIGVSACILLAGLGLSSLLSARFPYPAVQPGDSPFSQPQSTGGAAALIQAAAFIATVALTIPALGFGLFGLTYGGNLPLYSLLSGLVIGGATLVLGIWLGGRIFDRRGPELLAFTMRS